ncbi:glycosyltransferase [uncultured Chryseobacterium sp.]|uniref:glycosyltransferase n=1 Tax=uncultured Chryseobacterium sp. TaxID=259322 RepID=UPI0025FFD13E|nr:glycosyltransferase [uncultured Chryseobacterium sp.]
MQPLISVILPVYNAEKFIAYTIKSILQQTYSNFELIIINDGSIDNTLEVIKNFHDHRIILIDKKNTGLTDSLNLGIQKASGDWIARIDADDIAFLNRFEEQIKYLADDVAVVGTQCELIDNEGNNIGRITLPLNHNQILRRGLSFRNMFVHPTVMINKKMLLKSGLYDNYINAAEDLDLWLRLSMYGKLLNMDSTLLKYRMHENKISITKREEQLLNAIIAILKFKNKIYKQISEQDYLKLRAKVESNILYKLIVYLSKKSINKNKIVLKFYNATGLLVFMLLKKTIR